MKISTFLGPDMETSEAIFLYMVLAWTYFDAGKSIGTGGH
jgi:hypothetical protein